MESLYIPAGPDRFESSPLTGGPWRPDAQHGGPPAALLARTIESVTEPSQRVARLSVELLRPVPLTELTAAVELTRVSRRVARATASLADGAELVASATALLLATAQLPEPSWRPDPVRRDPEDATPITAPSWTAGDVTAFHRDAIEHRVVEGDFSIPGSAIEWIRLRQPLIAGEVPSPLVRVVAAADVASGISAIYEASSGVGLINADLSVALHRALVGEWVGIDAVTEIGPDGIGLCTNRLFDAEGAIGVATQSLIGWQTSEPRKTT